MTDKPGESVNMKPVDKGKLKVSTVAKELSKLESFSPHILEATLRGMDWNDIFRDYFRGDTLYIYYLIILTSTTGPQLTAPDSRGMEWTIHSTLYS